MKMNFIILLNLFMYAIGIHAAIPGYLHVCHRNDSLVSKCIIESVDSIRSQLIKGIPELDVPPLEPLILPEIVISRGNGDSGYRAIGRNVNVYGPGTFDITKLKLDIPNLTFFIGVKFPVLKFFADIDVNARILTVPVKGEGKLQAVAKNCFGNVILKAELYQENGTEKMRFKTMNLDLQIENIDVHLENIFGNDGTIDKAINEALQQNNQEIFNAIKPVAERTTSKILLEMINKIVKNFAFNEVFPE